MFVLFHFSSLQSLLFFQAGEFFVSDHLGSVPVPSPYHITVVFVLSKRILHFSGKSPFWKGIIEEREGSRGTGV